MVQLRAAATANARLTNQCIGLSAVIGVQSTKITRPSVCFNYVCERRIVSANVAKNLWQADLTFAILVISAIRIINLGFRVEVWASVFVGVTCRGGRGIDFVCLECRLRPIDRCISD